ncbi:unnamed protein product [Brassica oleracea]
MELRPKFFFVLRIRQSCYYYVVVSIFDGLCGLS